jgi:hypothetical protein
MMGFAGNPQSASPNFSGDEIMGFAATPTI